MSMSRPDHRCRVCGSPLPEARLLHFENMPAAAQFLPDAASLAEDRGIGLDIFQCDGCGLVQTGSPPVPYYREVVRAAAFSEEMKHFRRGQFAAFARTYGLQGRKVIEIGCGRGEYLALLREAGMDAYGLEYAEDAVRHCVDSGLQVTRGFVDSASCCLAGAPYDAFFVLNFLEHWPDPSAGLRGIAHNLRENGLGLVEVPNFDMILRNRLFAEFISDHICYFTRESLETTLRLNGFEVVETSEVWHGYILSAVVRRRHSCDVAPFEGARRGLKDEIGAYLARHAARGVAVWGAGHQALATIALLGLGGKIRYVIDSAPFKQNRFTPASHVPILAPENLRSDPVGAVIVMAASYSDEVARILREEHDAGLGIAIVRDCALEIVR